MIHQSETQQKCSFGMTLKGLNNQSCFLIITGEGLDGGSVGVQMVSETTFGAGIGSAYLGAYEVIRQCGFASVWDPYHPHLQHLLFLQRDTPPPPYVG